MTTSSQPTPLAPALFAPDAFIARHIGPDEQAQQQMLHSLGVASLSELITQTVPADILLSRPPVSLPAADEPQALQELKRIAAQNQIFRSFIGMGYSNTVTPPVILRNVLENPAWYTAYTPYQPEVAQGRLEALLNFQQLTLDLTGLDVASASLLDEATAAAEAMAMSARVCKRKGAQQFWVLDDIHPQTLGVLQTRAEGLGISLQRGSLDALMALERGERAMLCGVLVQYPASSGDIPDLAALSVFLQPEQILLSVAADPLALVLQEAPGRLGADIVFGSAQRFGVPMGYGGPHAAFFATRDAYKRAMPGRLIGVSRDAAGQPALRMAMQTREQHIRREKANSNICTSQVLLANMAGFYAVYHGAKGLSRIAQRVHRLTGMLAQALTDIGIAPLHSRWFDTLTFALSDTAVVRERALARRINLRLDRAGHVGITLDETTTLADLTDLYQIVSGREQEVSDWAVLDGQVAAQSRLGTVRSAPILTHPVFNRYHSETEMLRYLQRLARRDLALDRAMIPLGSCTMKLNATAEMLPITWPEFAALHPFCPPEQAKGYQILLRQLADWLAALTGYDAVSLQPNSGAQGEYAGLVAIRQYHCAQGQAARNICLIPASAHGTNPASAQLAGMQVVVVACDRQGNIDLADLRTKAEQAGEALSCIMVTYPSTHGVYEETIREACQIVHSLGGQVYLDGANMNAQVGLTSPGYIGADVSHLNLHKTFCIPHGGGGPGMGPIGVKAHLAPFLPGHACLQLPGLCGNGPAVSAAPFGSASILPISWMYIRMMGSQGLRHATEVAILNANYLASRLSAAYPVLYSGRQGRVAHECILDLRPLKERSGISEMDVAKRLIDYGFHAPTMSFPVAGTLMIEPTESESLAELDRFVDALLAIRHEIAQVEQGVWPRDNNPLVNAPHTQAELCADEWSYPYSREVAAFPVTGLRSDKYWPTVKRLDDVFGDRNLFCACIPTAEYGASSAE
ncbi:aminomethyl-transferring glycine dehydrogenase [Plesiomonas shigelloides]|uniref:aminomethyl-transferring glycine dehydrogenase n=1 Tax=Plesiomonas shigelloides TaxID=703 RepID=UPI001261AD1C|nr:aminomethyl-transferring glycine dehydrogenase [Plesiomonas shigelloides]KAB7661540.1 aminomethyl-transferring glycine dehydrogenase [Plesiomonas shigelloides]